MADRALTGVLLVGGASRRFGSPKALATIGGETLSDRGWRVLGEVCDERIAVGKAGELRLPFPVVDDGTSVRAPIAGVVAGLRAASNDVVVFLPVDCPLVDAEALRILAEVCRDVAAPERGPLPGAWSRSALPVLERRLVEGRLRLTAAYEELDVVHPALDEALLADADTPAELAELCRRTRRRTVGGASPGPTSTADGACS
jgi:molybdopterin-guanine dinucleotide biosynthesis protein A